MAKASVTLRLGSEGDDRIIAALKKIGETGDAAMDGLSREAKNAARDFDRLEKGLDANARSAAQVAKTYVTAERTIAAGVKTQEEAQRIIDLAVKKHINLTTALNDNAHSYGSMISRLSEWGRKPIPSPRKCPLRARRRPDSAKKSRCSPPSTPISTPGLRHGKTKPNRWSAVSICGLRRVETRPHP